MSAERTVSPSADGVHADARPRAVAPSMLDVGALVRICYHDFEAGERVTFDARIGAIGAQQFDILAVRESDGEEFGLRTGGPLTWLGESERVIGAAAVVEVAA